MNKLKAIMFLIMLAWLLSLLMNSGCSQKIYDRSTVTIGDMTIETVHIGVTGVATDTDLDGLAIESGSRKATLRRGTEEQDSIKVVTPWGVVESND